MVSFIREQIRTLGNEELYEIALDRERMRGQGRQSRRHSELLLKGLQMLTTSSTAESGLLNILLTLDQSESLDGSFVLVSGRNEHFEVFSSTFSEYRGTVWHSGDMFARLFERSKPIIVHDLNQPEEWGDKGEMRDEFSCAVHAPFRFGDSRAVLVCVSRVHGFMSYGHARLLFRLGPLLTQALLSIQNMRQLKEARTELEKKSKQLETALGEATHLARTDYLTQVFNRRSFFETAEKELRRAQRFDLALSVLVLDIDDFKAINDTYGHSAGDEVLKDLARMCGATLREFDTLARYGGEEFVALLPGTTEDQAGKVAERIRKIVAESPLGGFAQGMGITVSIGVAGMSAKECSVDTLIDHADEALLEAKKKGKDRVVLFSCRGEAQDSQQGS
jgi:diguanylate cyclase (GGDEF)-like protein